MIDKGNEVCDIVSLIRGYKSQNNLSLKTELESITIKGYSDFVRENEIDIKAVGNIKTINYENNDEKDVIINN